MKRNRGSKRGRGKRTRYAAGVMKGQPGHRSRSQKTLLSPKRWAEEKAKLMAEAPARIAPAKRGEWVEQQMKARYRMRTRRKR